MMTKKEQRKKIVIVARLLFHVIIGVFIGAFVGFVNLDNRGGARGTSSSCSHCSTGKGSRSGKPTVNRSDELALSKCYRVVTPIRLWQ